MPLVLYKRIRQDIFKWIHAHRYLCLLLCICVLGVSTYITSRNAQRQYESMLSTILYDTNDVPLRIKENSKGHYVVPVQSIPESFTTILIAKEDAWFYYHFGINPFSFVRAVYNYVIYEKTSGASTLTQQLTKNLLGTESTRTVWNKIHEAFYAISLELWHSKEDIVRMYANTVFLGNQIQGFETASVAYFNLSLEALSTNQQLALLATLSHPTTRNPWEDDNITYAQGLHERLKIPEPFVPPTVTKKYSFTNDAYFELDTSGVTCATTCRTTIDAALTKDLRTILLRHVENERARGVRNGAIVVIDPKNSTLLAVIGSPNPQNTSGSNQINMAIEPRPIGSTIKPLLYLKGFAEGLRPYTLVEDREYKYPIATGFSLYPKNYDGRYHGIMTLHEALSNSLNVPSVKVLEYIGLENFYRFLHETLSFEPIQELDSYQYGIALGGLEMDLMTLTHYFTLFPRNGILAPLRVVQDTQKNFNLPPQSHITKNVRVADEKYVELVETIMSDRLTGVNQFGLESNLNLTTKDYAVKTGTSRDFHDSWVVGYTPDFVVGVWIGNAENQALDQVSGASGAGSVWHDVMEYLLTTSYNTKMEFSYEHTRRIPIGLSDEWGLLDDIQSEHETLLQETNLITSIHDGDVFEYKTHTAIPLKAKTDVLWKVNGTELGNGREVIWNPTRIGKYEIEAFETSLRTREIVTVEIISKE